MGALAAMVLLHVRHLGLALTEEALGGLAGVTAAGMGGRACCGPVLTDGVGGGLVVLVGDGAQRGHLH